jgi:hypothetical protein
MPDENPTPASDHTEELDTVERDILYLLTGMEGDQPVWSVPDLGREMESTDATEVAVNGLHRAGLIHQTSDGFVFASRAGVHVVRDRSGLGRPPEDLQQRPGRASPLQPPYLHRHGHRGQARLPGPSEDQHELCRAAESHDADGHEALHTAD